MGDQLKELIAANKNLVDTAAPNQAVFPLILKKLEERRRKNRFVRRVLFSSVSSIAAILIIGFFVIKINQPTPSKIDLTGLENGKEVDIVADSPNSTALHVTQNPDVVIEQPSKKIQHRVVVKETQKRFSFQTAVSPAARLTAIYKAEKKNKINKQALVALFEILRTDPNTNVRLAAMDVLSSYISDSEIRRKMVYVMAKQDNPVVQLSMIQLLTGFKEKEFMKTLGQIIEDPKTDVEVREEAKFSYAQYTSFLNSKL